MNRTLFILKSVQYRIGWLGLLGLVLMLLATVLQLTVTHNIQEQISYTTSEILRGNELKKSQGHGDTTPAMTSGGYQKNFPNILRKEECIQNVLAIAEKNKLDLKNGQYSLTSADEGTIVTVKMTFPIQGTYPLIKQFLTSIIDTLPYASLNQINLHRVNNVTDLIQADIEIIFYFTSGANHAN